MPSQPVQKLFRWVTRSQPSRWTKPPFRSGISTSYSHRFSSQAPNRLIWFKPTSPLFSQFQQPASPAKAIPASNARDVPKRSRVSFFIFGGVFTAVFLSGSLYVYYRSLFAKVPVTNRERMLWYDRNYDEELGWAAEHWLLVQQNARPRLEEDSEVVKLARDILAKLQETKLAKDLKLKLYVYEDYFEPYACSAPAREGGRIFLNTGEFLACENIDEIAGVMSHEIGHIIARHVTERNAAAALARSIAQLFGWNAALGSDLISWRAQEREADHIGLVLMAQAGFEPNARVQYFEKHHSKEKEMLNGRDPMPETMSTHPSHESRVQSLKALLPEATAIFEKKQRSADSIKDTWDAARVILVEGMQAANAQVEAAQQLAPEVLLLKIENRLARLEDTFMQLSEAVLKIGNGKEEVLGKTLYAVALNQTEEVVMARPGKAEEKRVEPETANGGKIEEAAPQEAMRATPEALLERKETSEEAGKL
ncbi:hypothetical protein L207DRAFT_505650 [Hyaloscypha variabilis F]|uniref:Peptidase M48 domain-containing protein n=1 Tax=Hyaloscypha variabilis (strain UAMH 11265 / GT02V1 / F) TaxID=1149755 RepID=A0A2J6SCX2_HYAVF|nr:hypothetical protein L207DRAFT_505650 [Hyaloscypha variabilis F]